jgi:hypothetical protein
MKGGKLQFTTQRMNAIAGVRATAPGALPLFVLL